MPREGTGNSGGGAGGASRCTNAVNNSFYGVPTVNGGIQS